MEHEEKKVSFKETILRLIALKQEGGYWDFKKQWYSPKAKGDLLHDIICMANNLQNRDAYIIIGVDEENDYAIVDTLADQNRKNTQKLVDFLKNKKFAGGIRPVVHVEPIALSKGQIDVIVIENTHDTPFFLTDTIDGVFKSNIYTRVMDTNTPIDKSADINHIEYLWRKRFHLDETPLEKFSYYLSTPSEWDSIQELDMGFFYKNAPEYTIVVECDEDRNGNEYYTFGQIHDTPGWWPVLLKYHQTVVNKLLGISLDGGNSFVAAPHRAYELYDSGISAIGYFVRGELNWHLLEFFHQKECPEDYPYREFMRAVLVFASEGEKNAFFEYVKGNYTLYRELYLKQGDKDLPIFPEKKGMNMEVFKREYRDALVLRKMLAEFRVQRFNPLCLEETNHAHP